MSLQPRNIPHALPAPLPMRRATLPRLFTLEYDNSKVKSANPWTRTQLKDKHERWGVLWVEGGVSLSSGVYFTTLDELRDHFHQAGIYRMVWQDTGEEESNA